MRIHRIYRLIDPRFSEECEFHIRYVGCTRQSLKQRLRGLWGVRGRGNSRRHKWMRELEILGHKPEIELIEEVYTAEDGRDRELHWQKDYFYHKGYDIFNKPWREGKGGIATLSNKEKREQESFINETLLPLFRESNKIGVEKLLFKQIVLEEFYPAVTQLIADLIEALHRINEKELRKILSEDEISKALLIKVRRSIEKPLPIRPKYLTLQEIRQQIERRSSDE